MEFYFSVRENMYTTAFLPPLGHAVTILLIWAQHEQLKQLRLESMACVIEIVKPRCKGKSVLVSMGENYFVK